MLSSPASFIERTRDADRVLPRRVPAPGEAFSEYLFARRGWQSGEGFLQTSTWFVSRTLMSKVPFTRDLKRCQDLDWLLHATALPEMEVRVVPEVLAVFHHDEARGSGQPFRRLEISILLGAGEQEILHAPGVLVLSRDFLRAQRGEREGRRWRVFFFCCARALCMARRAGSVCCCFSLLVAAGSLGGAGMRAKYDRFRGGGHTKTLRCPIGIPCRARQPYDRYLGMAGWGGSSCRTIAVWNCGEVCSELPVSRLAVTYVVLVPLVLFAVHGGFSFEHSSWNSDLGAFGGKMAVVTTDAEAMRDRLQTAVGLALCLAAMAAYVRTFPDRANHAVDAVAAGLRHVLGALVAGAQERVSAADFRCW